MKTFEKDEIIDVQTLKSVLLKRKTTLPRFRLPMTKEQAVQLMIAAYEAEVEFRHGTCRLDENTTKAINSLAECLTKQSPKFGLMFCGTCGNGKTTMLFALRSAISYLARAGYIQTDNSTESSSLLVVDAKDIVSYARVPNEMKKLAARRMLAIEDLGKEAAEVLDYGNVINPAVDLLEKRYDNQLFTVITTNLRAREIREKYGDRIADRFNEMLDVIIFKGNSYRT